MRPIDRTWINKLAINWYKCVDVKMRMCMFVRALDSFELRNASLIYWQSTHLSQFQWTCSVWTERYIHTYKYIPDMQPILVSQICMRSRFHLHMLCIRSLCRKRNKNEGKIPSTKACHLMIYITTSIHFVGKDKKKTSWEALGIHRFPFRW